MRAIASVASAIFAFQTATADAAMAANEPLAGLRQFYLSVYVLPQEKASKCAADALTTDVEFILGQSRIVVMHGNAGPADGVIDLNVSLLDDCTASLSLTVDTGSKINRTGNTALATVWMAGYLREGFPSDIRERVELLTKQLVNEWSAANPK